MTIENMFVQFRGESLSSLTSLPSRLYSSSSSAMDANQRCFVQNELRSFEHQQYQQQQQYNQNWRFMLYNQQWLQHMKQSEQIQRLNVWQNTGPLESLESIESIEAFHSSEPQPIEVSDDSSSSEESDTGDSDSYDSEDEVLRSSALDDSSTPVDQFRDLHPLRTSSRRRVSFGDRLTNDPATILKKTIVIPSLEDVRKENLTDELWWDNKSLAKNRAESRAIADLHNEVSDPEYHSSVVYLMKSFQNQESDKSNSHTANCRKTLLKHVTTVAKANARGTEQRSVPRLRRNRKLAIKSVIDVYRSLKRAHQQQKRYGGTSNMALYDNEAKTVRQMSLQSSREARQLAFRLAQADRLIASNIYKEK